MSVETEAPVLLSWPTTRAFRGAPGILTHDGNVPAAPGLLTHDDPSVRGDPRARLHRGAALRRPGYCRRPHARWRPIEPHMFVPLGGRFNSFQILGLWPPFGIFNGFLGPFGRAR